MQPEYLVKILATVIIFIAFTAAMTVIDDNMMPELIGVLIFVLILIYFALDIKERQEHQKTPATQPQPV